jgi:PEP-CTERM motif
VCSKLLPPPRHAVLRPDCSFCGGACHIKDWRAPQVATLFGTVAVRLPRSGLQTDFTTSLLITFTDTASEPLSAPIPVDGGAKYFDFTDTTAITSVTITDNPTANGTDAWGIDDTSFGVSRVPVPEPASLALLGAGLIGLGLSRRRKSA